MQVVSHIYKSKLGRLYVLEPQKLIDGKLKCWIGNEIVEFRKGYKFVINPKTLTYNSFIGSLKKDVIKEIKSSENNQMK
jgi:hypothetical protein